jgi:hypothetical protein
LGSADLCDQQLESRQVGLFVCIIQTCLLKSNAWL